MPRQPVTHFNPPDDDVKTACGKRLAKVKHDTDRDRTTCKACKRVMHD